MGSLSDSRAINGTLYAAHDSLAFDENLRPKHFGIEGTSPSSKVLFRDVQILDSTGNDPYHGDVLIEGALIKFVGDVPDVESLSASSLVQVVKGNGRTLMSGLGDAHAHPTWNNNALNLLGDVPVEEHVLITANNARTFLDCGYTM